MFQRGGNAVDAACAMIAATSTMWDVLSWGGETQTLIYDPRQRKVVAINGLGIAPSGATPEFFRKQGLDVYVPNLNAFRDNAQKVYLASDEAKAWPSGMLAQINAMK